MASYLPPSFFVSTHDYHKHSRIASPIFRQAHVCSSPCSPFWGSKLVFEWPKRITQSKFLFYFLHAGTVGGRGVCVLQTCTRMRGQPAKPHTAARRAPRSGANGCADVRFLTCAAVQLLIFRPEAALGPGFSLQAAIWYQNAMLALFLRGKKSLKRSLILIPFRRIY